MSPGKHNASTTIPVCLPLRQVAENALGTDADRLRFWAKVHISSEAGCWVWTGAKFQAGYGQFSWSSRYGNRVPQGAHRCAWEMTHGEIPAGKHVLHSCDNRRCVNPSHLSLGGNAENAAYAAAKGRFHVPRPKRQKLTDEQCADIVAYVLTHGRGAAARVARAYGVSDVFVSLLVRGKRRQYRPKAARVFRGPYQRRAS